MRDSAENLLRDKSFFNPNWSESKIIQAVEKAYNLLLCQNVADDIYEIEVYGEKINICIKNGTISSAWGDYRYTLSDLGY